MSESFYTVSELNRFIKDVINAGFPQTIWVCGEIQQYDRNRGKRHIFFELVEKDADSSDIIARIGLVIFANRKDVIEGILKKSENAFTLKDDIEVKFSCKVDFYAPHGALRLIVENIDPTYTLGKLAQEKQKLIALLKKQGVFEKNKQRVLPPVPLRLGLITAADSAAYNDFIEELRHSGYRFQVVLRNTVMQGRNCEDDVCRALKALDTRALDAVVITRGGGSLADLSSFDSQKIACAIAAMDKPVLSGIGHEINLSVTDLTAHTFAKTPTAVAQFLIARVDAFLTELEARRRTVLDLAQDMLDQQNARLKRRAGLLHNSTLGYLKEHQQKMILYREVLKQRPQRFLTDARRSLDLAATGLVRAAGTRVFNAQEKLKAYEKMIAIVDPVNTLKRGFSITRSSNGGAVTRVDQIPVKATLVTQLSDGEITSRVTDVKKTPKG